MHHVGFTVLMEDDIQMHLGGWEGVDWLHLSQDRDK
jgi:hypothetical protein